MKTPLAILSSLCLTGQAAALDCMPEDIVQTYKATAESEASYVIVKGELRIKRPFRRLFNRGKDTTLKAHFDGDALGKSAFDIPFSRPLTITLACAGPYCGSVNQNTEVIAFIEETDDGLHMIAGPCGGAAFYTPTKKETNRLLSCHKDGICK